MGLEIGSPWGLELDSIGVRGRCTLSNILSKSGLKPSGVGASIRALRCGKKGEAQRLAGGQLPEAVLVYMLGGLGKTVEEVLNELVLRSWAPIVPDPAGHIRGVLEGSPEIFARLWDGRYQVREDWWWGWRRKPKGVRAQRIQREAQEYAEVRRGEVRRHEEARARDPVGEMRREAFESALGRASREWAWSTLEGLRAREERGVEWRRKNRERRLVESGGGGGCPWVRGLGETSEWDTFVRLFDDVSEGGYNDCYWVYPEP